MNNYIILSDDEEHSNEEIETNNGSSSKKKGKELLAKLAPGFLDPLFPLPQTPHTLHCKDKWVSDMSESATLTSSQLEPYLEFQPSLIKKTVESLRNLEQQLIEKDERLRSAETLEVELKRKLSESTDEIKVLRLEKSKVLIERKKYMVICDERKKKIASLEERNRAESKELNELCTRLLRDLGEESDKVTHLDLEKSRALMELEKYKLKCDDLSEEVVELTDYKVACDELIQKLAPKHQLKRNQECAEGEVNKKRKIANAYEPLAMPHVQSIEATMEADSSDDDSSESDFNKEENASNRTGHAKKVASVPAKEAEFTNRGSDKDMVPASKVKRAAAKAHCSSKEGRESFDEVLMRTCHQCKKKVAVLECLHCEKTRYCFKCIKKWYPKMSHKEIKEMCPFCRGSCYCTRCLSRIGKSKEGINLGIKLMEHEKVRFSKYLVHSLLPTVKEIDREQHKEKEFEARFQGVSVSELRVQQSVCDSDDQEYCDYCTAPIFDYHRKCSHCSYKLCIPCCAEIRNGAIHGGEDVPLEEYPHRNHKFQTQNLESCDGSKPKSLSSHATKWKVEANGSISCSCSSGILELKCIFSENWVSDTKKKAADIDSRYFAINDSGASTEPCTCFHKAARNIERDDLNHFQRHLIKGEPVLAHDVLDVTSGLSWHPMDISRILREKNVEVIDCLSWYERKMNIQEFLKGYTDGPAHRNLSLQMLMINDWPSFELFEKSLPHHFKEYISNLPFQNYTNPKTGFLNLAAKLPKEAVRPHMGPNTYIAYGRSEELDRGNAGSKLHCDKSDAVYVLMHTSELNLTPQQLNDVQISKEDFHSKDQIHEEPCGGAVWDVFRRQDVPKLTEYLTKYSKDLMDTYSPPLQQVVHPINDWIFYLSTKHKQNLKEEFGIEPWTFEQKLGDAIIIPAGCPYQVRNLKSCLHVGFNFVSPENVNECIILAEEFRKLPLKHIAREYPIEVKEMILHAINEAVNELEKSTE